MNSIKYFIFLITLVSFIGCEKEDETINLDVETYIKLLKANQYDSLNLPAFTYHDIPALLEYRNETQIISNFPRNPISSYYGPECKLGIYVLWTIESIRAISTDGEYLVMRFPSLNPVLTYTGSNELAPASDNISQSVAAKAYYDWWNNNKSKGYWRFNYIDPLENTDYCWH